MGKVVVTQEFNPGNARWCETHNRLECTKHRSKGRGDCHALAIRGLNACTMHSGRKKEVARAIGEARISAWNPYGRAEQPISAPMAVLGVLQMTWLRLGFVTKLLQEQVALEGGRADNPNDVDEPNASGLIGYRYGAAGKDGVVYVQSEEVRALATWEAAERDRIVKYAKTAHDMGISERVTQLAERWGDLVADNVSALLVALDLSPEQAVRVPALIQQHLGSIDLEALGAAENKAA